MGSQGTSFIQTEERNRRKMPGGGKQVTNSRTNSNGSSYRSYNDGGYAHSNSSGSRYYTGSGHGFYDSGKSGSQASGGQRYSTSYNYNQAPPPPSTSRGRGPRTANNDM